MIGHDYEGVKLEFALISIPEEGRDEEFGVYCALEVPVALKGEDRNGVGALLLPDSSHAGEHTPGAKAPLLG